jgi:8-oxo-dGTP pyrophosphatase MutT (NUDIX family)
MTNLDSYKVAPLNMIFLVDGDKVLTLKRNENKKIYPGKISGFGGKVEPGESMEASARREFLEEAGLEVEEMNFRGTFIRILDNGYINEMYIFVARGFTGKPYEISNEGKIEWHGVEDFLINPNTVDHIPLYLEQVIAGTDFYCGIAEYSQNKRISYTDNKTHFDERR